MTDSQDSEPRTTVWQRFREKTTGEVAQLRWEPDHQLPGGGAWEVRGEIGRLRPLDVTENWEAIPDEHIPDA